MRIAVLLLLTLATGWTGAIQSPPVAGSSQIISADLVTARRHLTDGNYPEAEAACNVIVNRLAAVTDKDRTQRKELASAYEVLAMVQYRLIKPQVAETYFTQLLTVDPAYVVGDAVTASKAEKELFAKRKGELVGVLRLEVRPDDAKVQVNGVLVESRPIELEVLVGTVSVSASRTGYVPAIDKKYDVVLGAPTPQLPLSLELRRSSTFEIVTAPAGVEVRIDRGQPRTTTAGTPTKAFEDILRTQSTVDSFSGVLSFTDIGSGEHSIEFKKECFTTESVMRTIPPGQHDTIMIAHGLREAKATVKVAGAGTIYVDDVKAKPGAAGDVEVCAGSRMIDVRTERGRSVHRIENLATGETREILSKPRPAVAILDVVGTPASPGDFRVSVEAALQRAESSTLTIFAPSLGLAQTARQAEGLKADWLSFDLARNRIVGSQAAGMSDADRRKSSQALADALEVQGVASISVPNNDEPLKVILTLLAAGSGVPDVILIDLHRSELRLPQHAFDQLGSVKVFENSIGVQTIDVRDVSGAVVVRHLWRVDASLPALNKGDRIVFADTVPIKNTATLREYVQSKKPDDRINLRVERGAAVIDITVGVSETPRLIGVDDETLLPNKLILDFNDMLKEPGVDENRKSAIRLNLAVALMRVGNWDAARRELMQLAKSDAFVVLGEDRVDRPGVSNGTVQYLLGLCLKELRQDAEALAIFNAVAKDRRYAEALLTQDGVPVRELAARFLK